jgi:hypothetical protein
MEYSPDVQAIKLPALDTRGMLHRKASQAMKACDAADILDGFATLQNPTLRVVAIALGVSIGSVVLARRLTLSQRQAVRNGWRPLRWQPRVSDLPAPPTAQERFAGIVSELGGVAGALNELAAIERNGNGNGHVI